MSMGGVGRVSPPSTVTTALPWEDEGLQRGPGLNTFSCPCLGGTPLSPGQRAQAGWPRPLRDPAPAGVLGSNPVASRGQGPSQPSLSGASGPSSGAHLQ